MSLPVGKEGGWASRGWDEPHLILRPIREPIREGIEEHKASEPTLSWPLTKGKFYVDSKVISTIAESQLNYLNPLAV